MAAVSAAEENYRINYYPLAAAIPPQSRNATAKPAVRPPVMVAEVDSEEETPEESGKE